MDKSPQEGKCLHLESTEENGYSSLKRSKVRNLQVKKKKLRLDGKGIFSLLLHDMIPFKVTSSILDRFFLVNLSSIPVNLRVKVGLIGEELVGSFGVDGLGRSLSLGIDGNMRKIQVKEESFDLTKAVVKTISKGPPKLLQEGVRVMVISHYFLLSLTEVTLCL